MIWNRYSISEVIKLISYIVQFKCKQFTNQTIWVNFSQVPNLKTSWKTGRDQQEITSGSTSQYDIPDFPTEGAPTTATFTSASDDFLRRIPRLVIVCCRPGWCEHCRTTPAVCCRRAYTQNKTPAPARLLKIYKATALTSAAVLMGQDLAKITVVQIGMFTSSCFLTRRRRHVSVAAGQRHFRHSILI